MAPRSRKANGAIMRSISASATAIFSIFRRTSEVPLYQIVKDPRLSRKQGQYAVIAQGGLIMKRGHDLAQVLRVLLGKPKLVTTLKAKAPVVPGLSKVVFSRQAATRCA